MTTSITGLGSETTILLTIPTRDSMQVEFQPMGDFFGYATTKRLGYEYGMYGKRRFNLNFEFYSKKEVKDFINFYKDRKGSLKRFWIPCWYNEFELKSKYTAADIVLKIYPCEITQRNDGYMRIFIQTKNDFFIRRITSTEYNSDSDADFLYIDTKLNIDILPTDIILFGRVILGRFDGDLILTTIQVEDKSYLAKASINFVELPHEYKEMEV